MECREPGAVRDEELMAFVEGETVRPEVRAHLARCPQCASRVRLYQSLEHKLISHLYRWNCPSNQELGDYHLGLLSYERMASIQEHLRDCVLCTEELLTLADFLGNNNDPVVARRQLPAGQGQQQNIIAAPPSLSPPSPPVFSPLNDFSAMHHVYEETRGTLRRIVAALILPEQSGLVFQRGAAATSWPRSYAVEDVTVSLQLEPDIRQRNLLQLIGFVVQQGHDVDALQDIVAQLLSGEGVVQVQHIDELGNVVFSALAPDLYTLELLFPDRTLVVEQLPVELIEES